jgi:hypothetical protein
VDGHPNLFGFEKVLQLAWANNGAELERKELRGGATTKNAVVCRQNGEQRKGRGLEVR